MLTSDGKGHYLLHFTFLGGVVNFLIYRLDSCACSFQPWNERERMCAVIIYQSLTCWKHNVTNVAVVGVQWTLEAAF